MARLVVLTEGFAGRAYELKVDKTTIGRVEDNTFPITEGSVSSHHCEVLLKGSDVVIKDLNSTNGTFINGKRVTEDVLKPGQILRLGQVEMKLEAAGASAPATTATTSRKPVDQTMVIQQEAIRTQIIEGPKGALPTSKGFSKKTNSVNRWFIIGGIILGLIIIGLLIFVVNQARSGG
jgi:pSer/pThr/pTyr-binding forkhead associated (FHA) protein